MRRVGIIFVCLTLPGGLLIGMAGSGLASFPGANDRLALTWTTEPGVTTDFIATVESDGSGFTVLEDCDYECHHRGPEWSPDGRRLVYVRECPDCLNEIVIVRPDGSRPRVLVRAHVDGFLESPVWSPDGNRIAFVEYRWPEGSTQGYASDIYVIDADGTDRRRITRTPGSEDDIDWSSKGLLVFVSLGRNRAAYRNYELFTMRPDGTHLRRLTRNRVAEWEPDWAPGGRRLTFRRKGAWGLDSAEVWVMNPRKERRSLVASGFGPAWAPDGSVIAFARQGGELYTIQPSGEEETLIGAPVDEGEIGDLDWRVASP